MCIVAVKMEKTIAKEESEVDDPQPVDKDEFKVDLKDLDEGPIEIKEEPLDETEAQPSTSKKTDIKLEVKAECDIDSESCDSSSIDYNAIKEEPPDDDEDDDDEDVEMDEDDPDGDEELSNLGDVDMKFEASEETLQDGKGLPIKCPHCPYRTTTDNNLRLHKRIHRLKKKKSKNGERQNSENKYNCEQCHFTTMSQSRLNVHNRNFHSSDPNALIYKCDSCHYETKNRTIYRHHMYEHKSFTYMLPCMYCDELLASEQSINRHVKVHHRDIEILNCRFCDFTGENGNELGIHKKENHPQTDFKLYDCELCEYKSLGPKYLVRHQRKVHKKYKF